MEKVPPSLLATLLQSNEFQENAGNLETINAKPNLHERLDALRAEFHRAEHLSFSRRSWWLLEANQHARNSAYYLLREEPHDYKVLGVFWGQSCIVSENGQHGVIVSVTANYGGGHLGFDDYRLKADRFIRISTRAERVHVDQ
jgi:hypothetical protein